MSFVSSFFSGQNVYLIIHVDARGANNSPVAVTLQRADLSIAGCR